MSQLDKLHAREKQVINHTAGWPLDHAYLINDESQNNIKPLTAE